MPEPLPAWATPVSYITATCTECGEAVENGDGDPLLFVSVAHAVESITEYEDGQVDGDTLTCRSCLALAACAAAGGHDIRTVTHPVRPGMAWYCAREHCPAGGMVRPDTGSGGHDGR